MTAKLDGFDPKVSYHDSKYDADIASGPLADKGAEIAVEEVTVFLNDDGDVVHAASGVEPAPADADLIPF